MLVIRTPDTVSLAELLGPEDYTEVGDLGEIGDLKEAGAWPSSTRPCACPAKLRSSDLWQAQSCCVGVDLQALTFGNK